MINESIDKINTILNGNKIFSKSNYWEFIDFLNEKHGKPTNDYFNFDSYKNHLNRADFYLEKYSKNKKANISPIKNHGKNEKGIYLHHINEYKFKNLGDPEKIYKEKVKGNKNFYSFSNQKKNKLVRCNILEHTFLHALILLEFENNSINESNGYCSLSRNIKKSIDPNIYKGKTEEEICKIIKSLDDKIKTKFNKKDD